MRTFPVAAALAALFASTLTAGLVGSQPAQAAPEDPWTERWCSTDAPPCLESLTRNGTPVTESSADWEVQTSEFIPMDGYRLFMWTIEPIGSTPLTTADTWTLTYDTGTLIPEYTEAYAGKPVFQGTADGDGTYHVTYTANPVLTTDGCDSSAEWPWPCPVTATDWRVQLTGEVHQKNLGPEWVGFSSGQSVDGYNGIFLETAPDDSKYLYTELVNSHQYDVDKDPATTGDLTVFEGQIRFRVPYAMLRNDFGVPNPATMVASSLSGTVRRGDGTTAPATWHVFHDPAGPAIIIDISGLTFSLNKVRVRRGVITPTRPGDLAAERRTATRGVVGYDSARPRGARVTGHTVRCVSPGGHVRTTTGRQGQGTLTGLRPGVRYSCKVRALSKAGPGLWSGATVMPARP